MKRDLRSFLHTSRRKSANSILGSSATSTTVDAEIQSPTPPRTPENVDESTKDGGGDGPTQGETCSERVYPSGLKLVLILISLMTSMFLVALDRLIIATAVPQITNDFRSVTDIGWYASSFLLTNAAFQLAYGKLYTFWRVKRVFLSSVLLFEIGSAICGAAGSSAVFIFGRALSGVGGGGIFSGAIVILVHSVPLHRRPMFQGIFGATFGIASVVGPLLGGVFTTSVTWRWCFYINLPLGAITVAIIIFLLDIPPPREEHHAVPGAETPADSEQGHGKKPGSWRKLRQLDFAGTSVFIPGIVCLLLVLQWGGVDHPWNSAVIIALLVLAAVLLSMFVVIQILLPDTATVPPRILSQRTMISAFLTIFCIGAHMMTFVYFIPIWFQAIQGASAVSSGTKTIPLVLSLVVATSSSGAIVSRLGPYIPPLHIGALLAVAGAALLTTLRPDSPPSHWIGYQVAYGLGLGLCFQVPNVAAQTVLPEGDIPVGTALIMFSQLIGGAVFVSVGQSVLVAGLTSRLAHVEDFDVGMLQGVGVTTLLAGLDEHTRDVAVEAYNDALRSVFRGGLGMTCIGVLAGSFMEWRSVKEKKMSTPAPQGRDEGARDGDTVVVGLRPGDGEVKTESKDDAESFKVEGK
ncbi:related to MFS multidrug transporter [Cephalotrichum gorgonifer]|uniref:Related to MFS multidrug transporter n=1 Tax=Cephalotrichum gorgonifer TaxID=2041049 RepID=A0AAE8N605_9PEZI|nr:related to MFS multidrug transporter [Cephalotrichum gorgonifer]